MSCERTLFSRSSSVSILILLLGLILSVASSAQQPPGTLPFPSPATPKLATNFQVTVSGQSLRELIQSIQNATKLPIILDRRVDPTAPAIFESPVFAADPQAEAGMRSHNLGPTLHQALDKLVEARNESASENTGPSSSQRQPIGWASASELILIGPSATVNAAAAEMLVARQRLQPHISRYPAQRIGWPFLTTPQEALQIVAAEWNLDVSAIKLPHDLWPVVELGEVNVTTALGVIASQFDLCLELNPTTRTVTQRPLNNAATFRNTYVNLPLTDRQREAITDTGARLQKRNNVWDLTGQADAHFQLELAIFRRGANVRNPARSTTVYSLKFEGTVGDAFRNLCQAGNLELDISSLNVQQQQAMIVLEVKDKSINDILAAVAEKANLQLGIQGNKVTVTNN